MEQSFKMTRVAILFLWLLYKCLF